MEAIYNIKTHYPSWMPGGYLRLIKNKLQEKGEFRFSDPERRVMRKRTPLKPSVWAEKYRVITDSDIKGPQKHYYTPYMVGIMDAADFLNVQTVSICKCVQSGGSESIHSLVGYLSDRKPGHVMYVYPDKDAGKRQMRKRILPMFRESPRLSKLLTGKVNDEKNLGIQLQHYEISIAWAHSPSSLASDSVPYVIFDETDKYPSNASKKETDPISLGEKRTTTYKRRNKAKIIKISTPTIESGYIWKALTKDAQVIFDYFAKCPTCGRYQVMTFDRIKWPETDDYKKIESEFLAYYECKHCPDTWNDDNRNRAVRAGEWRSRGKEIALFTYLESFKPKNIGFHVPAWISFFVSLSQSATAYLKGEKGDPQDKQDFQNNYAAEPYRQVIVTSDTVSILKARTKLPPQTVPQEAVALTAVADVQKRGFWYVVRAWAPNYDSWLIDYGDLQVWDDVEELFFNTTYPIDGRNQKLGIWRATVDIGGSKYDTGQSMTEASMLWLQKVKGRNGARVWGTKGSSHPMGRKVQRGSELRATPSGKPLKNGFRIYTLDTDKFKDIVYDRLGNASEEGTGIKAYLHKETGEDYAKQILAEVKEQQRDGSEKWIRKKPDNHFLDCEVMSAALADWEWPGGGVNLLKRSSATADVKSKKKIVRKPARSKWMS